MTYKCSDKWQQDTRGGSHAASSPWKRPGTINLSAQRMGLARVTPGNSRGRALALSSHILQPHASGFALSWPVPDAPGGCWMWAGVELLLSFWGGCLGCSAEHEPQPFPQILQPTCSSPQGGSRSRCLG